MKLLVSGFLDTGFIDFGSILDVTRCSKLFDELLSLRNFSSSLFSDEASFRNNPLRKGVNPAPGRNIIEKLNTSFIEEDLVIRDALEAILGPGYQTVMKKVVAAIPAEWIPEWVKREIAELPVPNLGAFVKPEYRDITYFHGIDFHQDMIDYPDRHSDFVTLYIYLDKVTENDSPLLVLPGTHDFGVTLFPHDLKPKLNDKTMWKYSDRRGSEGEFPCATLVGPSGSAYLWHACTMHGTQPSALDQRKVGNRISLRYVIAKAERTDTNTLIDQVNRKIHGPLNLAETRNDLDKNGAPLIHGNSINRSGS